MIELKEKVTQMNYHVSLKGNQNDIGKEADLNMFIVVGMGDAIIKRNDEIIFQETSEMNENDIPQLKKFDEMAEELPGKWICILYSPLSNHTFERQSKGKWICIESGQGFA